MHNYLLNQSRSKQPSPPSPANDHARNKPQHLPNRLNANKPTTTKPQLTNHTRRIQSLPRNDRPRERLLQHGARHLSNVELLAILVRCGHGPYSALDIARNLLQQDQGRVAPLFNLDPKQCQQHPGIGPAIYCQISAALELARRQLQERLIAAGPVLANSEPCKHFLSACLRAYQHEVFACLFLDRQWRVIHYQELFHGSIDQTAVYPRELIKQALQHNASAVIIAHNHPSGKATPSTADISLTKELRQALAYVYISLVDHFVIGDPEVYSMAEHGMLDN